MLANNVATPVGVQLKRISGRHVQFVDIGVEYPVRKPDTRRFVRILVGEFDVDLPDPAFERSCFTWVSLPGLAC